MAQPKPERISIEEILKLVEQLSPEGQEQLVEEVKLQWLRREVQKGIDSLDRGEGLDGDQVFAELKERYEHRKAAN